MSSGSVAQDGAWKSREQSAEAKYIHEKEQAQLAAIRAQTETAVHDTGVITGGTSTDTGPEANTAGNTSAHNQLDRDIEGGFGGQEDLEDRYATTSGEH